MANQQRNFSDMNEAPSSISKDAPTRLSVAAKLAFPDGSMTVSGLRREAGRGRLRIERIAGKDFTTLQNINDMRELCRVEQKEPDSGYVRKAMRPSGDLGERRAGSFSTAAN